MNCPDCGYKFDCHTNPYNEKAKPEDRDIGMCLNCGAIYQFKDGSLVDVDIEKLPDYLQEEIAKFRKARKKVVGDKSLL